MMWYPFSAAGLLLTNLDTLKINVKYAHRAQSWNMNGKPNLNTSRWSGCQLLYRFCSAWSDQRPWVMSNSSYECSRSSTHWFLLTCNPAKICHDPTRGSSQPFGKPHHSLTSAWGKQASAAYLVAMCFCVLGAAPLWCLKFPPADKQRVLKKLTSLESWRHTCDTNPQVT